MTHFREIPKPKQVDDDDPDIVFMPVDEKHSVEDDIVDEIEDLYSEPSNPPRPPQSIRIGSISFDDINEFWKDSVHENDIFDTSNLPSADHNGRIYIMNYIFLPYEQMMSIFLLTSEYLDPNHGLHSWPSKKRRNDLPDLYKNIRSTIFKEYKDAPLFACVFKVDSTEEKDDNNLWISRVDFVPNNTTRDRYVNYGTEILRCDVPMGDMNKYYKHDASPFYDEEYNFEFLLTQKWRHLLEEDHDDYLSEDDLKEKEGGEENYGKLVHASLSFEMGMRSGRKLYGLDDGFIINKANQNRYLTLCMPPISEPLAFISETIGHYISNIGIEHIYLGTFFKWDKVEEHRQKLIERIQPWYDRGLVTIWPHEQPWIGFTDKAKSHWLHQCLYYVKSRDSYTLSLDADEFLVLNEIENVYKKFNEEHDIDDNGEDGLSLISQDEDLFEERQKLMQNVVHDMVKNKVNEFDDDHFCWMTFQSWQMWQLAFPDENYMIKRFIGREDKAQLTWSKVIWNTKHLHYGGYHAGGACSAQGHDWTQIVFDWREQIDRKHVYRFIPEKEGGLFHYYNCRQVRIEPKDRNQRNPWSKTVNDTRMLDIYWENIENEFKLNKLVATYPDESDVMNTKYYRTHYGFGNSMANWQKVIKIDT